MEPEELEALTDEELDGRCRPAALAVTRTLLRNLPQEEAEECANDVMLRLLTHRERYEPSRGSLLTYVRVMARTEALSRLRRWNSRPLTLPLDGTSLHKYAAGLSPHAASPYRPPLRSL